METAPSFSLLEDDDHAGVDTSLQSIDMDKIFLMEDAEAIFSNSGHAPTSFPPGFLEHQVGPSASLGSSSIAQLLGNVEHISSGVELPINGSALEPLPFAFSAATLSTPATAAAITEVPRRLDSTAKRPKIDNCYLSENVNSGHASQASRKPSPLPSLPPAPPTAPSSAPLGMVPAPPATMQQNQPVVNGNGKRFRPYQADQWFHRYQELAEYRQKFGNCLVPHNYKENQALAQWVKRQRYQHKLKTSIPARRSTLTDERLALLDALGFVWDSHEINWQTRFHQIVEFYQLHGHTNVPSSSNSHATAQQKQLSAWLKSQRRQYRLFTEGKTSNMTQSRIDQLEQIHFCWAPRDT